MWIITGVICFVMLLAIGVMQSARFRAFRHVSKRPRLTESEFAESFFPVEHRELAIKVLQLLAPYLTVNTGRIHPSDLLVDELGLAAGLSDGLDVVAFVQDLEDEFKIVFTEDDYLQMQTFQDTVEIISKKTKKN